MDSEHRLRFSYVISDTTEMISEAEHELFEILDRMDGWK